MGMYYNDVKEITGFTEESLRSELCKVFGAGLAALVHVQGEKSSDLDMARHECLMEVFTHAVALNFPNLDELKSNGALQNYVDVLESAKRKEASMIH